MENRYQISGNTPHETDQLKLLYKILPALPFYLFSIFEISHKHNWYLNIDLDGKKILLNECIF